MDEVVVRAAGGIEAGVGIGVYGDDVENRDVGRERFVEAEQEVEVPGCIQVDVEEELAGVYGGIGAAAAEDGYGYFQDAGDGGFQYLLYAYDVGKSLPSAVLASVVPDVKEVSQSCCVVRTAAVLPFRCAKIAKGIVSL